ncbi:hypothetical protein B0H11DRAFT_2348236 [Mycena galericulata]|nr:hypothetical protein B0H11DRAFT_2348236 [Mycena galericulata]
MRRLMSKRREGPNNTRNKAVIHKALRTRTSTKKSGFILVYACPMEGGCGRNERVANRTTRGRAFKQGGEVHGSTKSGRSAVRGNQRASTSTIGGETHLYRDARSFGTIAPTAFGAERENLRGCGVTINERAEWGCIQRERIRLEEEDSAAIIEWRASGGAPTKHEEPRVLQARNSVVNGPRTRRRRQRCARPPRERLEDIKWWIIRYAFVESQGQGIDRKGARARTRPSPAARSSAEKASEMESLRVGHCTPLERIIYTSSLRPPSEFFVRRSHLVLTVHLDPHRTLPSGVVHGHLEVLLVNSSSTPAHRGLTPRARYGKIPQSGKYSISSATSRVFTSTTSIGGGSRSTAAHLKGCEGLTGYPAPQLVQLLAFSLNFKLLPTYFPIQAARPSPVALKSIPAYFCSPPGIEFKILHDECTRIARGVRRTAAFDLAFGLSGMQQQIGVRLPAREYGDMEYLMITPQTLRSPSLSGSALAAESLYYTSALFNWLQFYRRLEETWWSSQLGSVYLHAVFPPTEDPTALRNAPSMSPIEGRSRKKTNV